MLQLELVSTSTFREAILPVSTRHLETQGKDSLMTLKHYVAVKAAADEGTSGRKAAWSSQLPGNLIGCTSILRAQFYYMR